MQSAHPGRDAIELDQLQRLRRLLDSALPANAFYTAKISKADIHLDTLGSFSRTVPFTTKAEIVADQQQQPPYGTNLTYPVQKYTRFHQTSGTTGTPLRWLDTPESWQALVDSWKEVYGAAGTTADDRVFFAFSFGPFIGFWLAFAAAEQLGCLCIPAGGMSSEARLRVLMDNEATVLCCTPTYALHLAEVAAKIGVDLRRAKIRTILVAGEPGGSIPATRKRLEQLWPTARIFDHHGMTEVGPVTYECPAQPGVLHVIESGYFAESINPSSGLPAAIGDTGELVLTTLGRIGSPLIRYRTGDSVRLERGTACVCGRHETRLVGGILGRIDDMVIVRGVNIYPSAVEDVLRRFADVSEYRVHFTQAHALAELSVEIEPAPGTNEAAASKSVANALQTAFNLRIPVKAVPAGTLPRFEMKSRRWVRE